MGRSRKILVAAIAFAVLLTSVGLVLSQSPRSPPTVPPGLTIKVEFVGDRGGLAGQVLTEFLSRGFANPAAVTRSNELAALAGQVDRSSIILFDTNWLLDKASDSNLQAFLTSVLPTEASIVAIGGSTHLLFDVLKLVDERVAGSGRNYAYDDPPAAGYMLRRATAPDGTEYFGNSIFGSYTSDIDTIVDSILAWKAREAGA